ncbi:cell division protein FtsZ [uncultured Thiodictyon sp.]|uniref:cell division protein FtsZ n=1 Tax=uncultured Thiodictyon sp. TaxID=1846217 RepID=UPI0025D06872|nr:cell division protein FtsZ [uncultured Thiodictyon sp.]
MVPVLDIHNETAVVKVIGIGGGGRGAINHMVESAIEGVDFICADTDTQALNEARAKTLLQFGLVTTKGLGACGNPDVGNQAALEDRESVAAALAGADMIMIIVGMGGGTGTGAAPVVAEVAKELGILTVAMVTMPCPFEGSRRRRIAKDGIAELIKHVDSLITIPNNKRFADHDSDLALRGAFNAVNHILWNATRSIAELITCPTLIAVDFADVTTVLSGMGVAMVGTGSAVGPERAHEAAAAAIHCPLLEHIDLAMAKGMLVTIIAGYSLTMTEFDEVGNTVRDCSDDDAQVVIGVRMDVAMEDELRVTIVATGLADRFISAVGFDEIARRKEIICRWKLGELSMTDNSLYDYQDIPAFLLRPTS